MLLLFQFIQIVEDFDDGLCDFRGHLFIVGGTENLHDGDVRIAVFERFGEILHAVIDAIGRARNRPRITFAVGVLCTEDGHFRQDATLPDATDDAFSLKGLADGVAEFTLFGGRLVAHAESVEIDT